MSTHRIALWVVVGLLVLTAPSAVLAQTLGTFRWQLQPYCNVITVTVTLNGGVYTLDGFDDQCGAGQRASVAGTAFLNPDGSIGLGLAIVTAPSGAPLHVDVALSLATVGGPWRDSTGAGGSFVFNPAAASGTPRPAPIPAFAAGLVVGQSTLLPDGSIVARGIDDVGAIPALGAGLRAMWFAGRGAFRAGEVSADAWDEASLGPKSAAFGYDTRASAAYSFATGYGSQALEKAATAMGSNTHAAGQYSTAFGVASDAVGLASVAGGYLVSAIGVASTAFGKEAYASGDYSVAAGATTNAIGLASTALGFSTHALGANSTALGSGTHASGANSTALGFETTAGGVSSVAAGHEVTASADYSIALGRNVSTTTRTGSFIFGDNSGVANTVPTANNQFVVRATGGVRFLTSTNLVNGCEIAPTTGNLVCSGTITGSSDRNRKQDIAALDGDEVLARIATLPVTTWSFIEAPGVRHAGPMAQDFRAAFGLGENDTSISYTDINGINMRAIQALIEEIAKLRERVAELEATRFRRLGQ